MNVTKSTQDRPWRQTLVLLVLLSLPLAPSAFAGNFTGVVFFGDSLSDPGNHFAAFRTISHQPFVPIPDDSYAIGGHHFSNGATWAEQLAETLHLPTSGDPALRVPGVFTNYAVGRARARPGAPSFPDFDLSTQVGQFLSDFGGHASSTDLYVVWIGNNDLGDALRALASDPPDLPASFAIIQAAITAVAGNIQALYVSGARTFLVPNVLNPAITPAVRALGEDAQVAASLLTAGYNGALDQVLTALGGLPEIRFVRLDVNLVFANLQEAPAAAGLTNAVDSCLTFGVIGGAICRTPHGFLFWDGIHPTTTGHGFIAEAALLKLDSP